MFCPNCGGQIPDDARFCTDCGKTVEVPEVANTQPQPEQEYQPQTYTPPSDFSQPQVTQEYQPQTYTPPSDFNQPQVTQEYQPQSYAPPSDFNQPQTTQEYNSQTYTASTSGYSQPQDMSGNQPVSSAYNQAEYPQQPAQQTYQNMYQESYDRKFQQPKKKNSRLVIGALCVVGLLVVGVLVWMFVGGIFGGGGSAAGGYDKPEDLMSVYFGAFQESNDKTVADLMLPQIVDYAILEGFKKTDLPAELDEFYEYYGNKVVGWYISETFEWTDDFTEYWDIKIDESKVEKYIDYTAEVTLGGPKSNEELTMEFSLVKYDGKWYLTDVWNYAGY